MQVIGVPGRDTVEAMRRFVERHGLDFLPHAADPEGKVWADLGVRYQPTWIFVNGTDGKVTREFGDFDGADLRSRFDDLIAR